MPPKTSYIHIYNKLSLKLHNTDLTNYHYIKVIFLFVVTVSDKFSLCNLDVHVTTVCYNKSNFIWPWDFFKTRVYCTHHFVVDGVYKRKQSWQFYCVSYPWAFPSWARWRNHPSSWRLGRPCEGHPGPHSLPEPWAPYTATPCGQHAAQMYQ